jgi:class 3 adenylate cyclase
MSKVAEVPLDLALVERAVASAHPTRRAVDRFKGGDRAASLLISGLGNGFETALEHATCGVLVFLRDQLLFRNRAALKDVNCREASDPCTLVVPLSRHGLSALDLTLHLTGDRLHCEELAARVDRVLSEIEGVISLLERGQVENRGLLTMMFTDIVDSTNCAERLGDARWHVLLSQHNAIVRRQLMVHRGREIDDAGDGFFATFDAPARAVRCAQAIRNEVRTLGLEIRAGIHTGECDILGRKVTGVAVHVAARVAAAATAGQILVSSTVKELAAGSDFAFTGGDWHSLRGVSDSWRLFSVTCSGVAA